MENKKKVAICLPGYKEGTLKKTGFLSETDVASVEEKLSSSDKIEFIGNLDISKMELIGNELRCGDVVLNDLDLFFWYAPGMRKHMEKLKELSKKIKVLKSPESYETVADKFLAHTFLKNKDFPVVDFLLIRFDDLEKMESVMRDWGTVVIKPRRGSFGRGIIKVNDFETLRDIAGYIRFETKQEEIFIEKYCENPIEEWISTTIIGGKVAYGYRKKKEKFAGWKVYDVHAKGGDAYYVDPSPIREVAEKAAQAIDESIVGFDFIKTSEGYKIVDENNFPGFYPEAFKDAGVDAPTLIADLMVASI